MSARHWMTDHAPGCNGRAVRPLASLFERVCAIAVVLLATACGGVNL